MKSRTSYFNKVIFKKAMTRFAPAWVLYTICLLLGMLLMRDDGNIFWFHSNVAELLPVMSVINLFYAMLATMLLFGDLYNSRMCFGIHALPVTREELFGSHTAAGFAWNIIPTVSVALLALILGIGSTVEGGWQIPLWWLLGSNLQYLFFFGLATFSALCVGSRFAQAVVYGLFNFTSIIAYWLAETLYTPMLYGVMADSEAFTQFSPVVWFASSGYIDVHRQMANGETIGAWFELSDGWGYLAICAVLGAALLAGAYLLYRKRNLESAGDFMAVKKLEPVFLVVYSLIIASILYYFCSEMMGMGGISAVYIAIGLAIGFFTGRMLLERTNRVFRKQNIIRFAVLGACFALTLLVTSLDPFGIVKWIPEESDVASVVVSPSYGRYYYNTVTLDEPDEIADILRVHEHALEYRDYEEAGYAVLEDGEVYANNQTISIHYTLKNGTTRSRYYVIDLRSEAGQLMIPWFNTLEAIFGTLEGDLTTQEILKKTQAISVSCDSYTGEKYSTENYGYTNMTDPEDIRQLLEAIEADAALGTMAQNWNFRPDPMAESAYWLDFDLGINSASITIHSDCVNTCAWLTEHGFISLHLEMKG